MENRKWVNRKTCQRLKDMPAFCMSGVKEKLGIEKPATVWFYWSN